MPSMPFSEAPLTTIMTQEFDLQRLADRLGKDVCQQWGRGFVVGLMWIRTTL
jgi:hypothetical protein